MTADGAIGEAEIRTYLHEVAEELPTNSQQHSLIIVGGALLACHGLRQSTRDVDSVQRIDAELQEAVRRVAVRRDLAPNWVNHNAAPFAPLTLEPSHCEVIVEHPRLKVLGAPLHQVFLMKVRAARERDYEDLVAIGPRLGLSAEELVAEYWRAYPDAPADDYLLSWILAIDREASLGD